MRQIFGLLFLFSIVACSDRPQMTSSTTVNAKKSNTSSTTSNRYGFDTAYEISKGHTPPMVTGYFNIDNILDTALLIRHKTTRKSALFIKHGKTGKFFLLKSGKDVGQDFNDFHWVGQFEVIKKGTKIWDNVIDGEIVDEDQVSDNKKITLKGDAIMVHEDEGGGGGIIYFNNGKYAWVQQD